MGGWKTENEKWKNGESHTLSRHDLLCSSIAPKKTSREVILGFRCDSEDVSRGRVRDGLEGGERGE